MNMPPPETVRQTIASRFDRLRSRIVERRHQPDRPLSRSAFFGVLAVALGAGFASGYWLLDQGVGAAATVRVEALRTALGVVAGVGATAGLYLSFKRHRLAQLSQDEAVYDAEQRRNNELYAKASEQLGSEKAPVRLAALYSMERLAQGNLEDRQKIVDLICAYLRMPLPEDIPSTSLGPSQTLREEREVRLTAQRILAEHLRPDRDLPGLLQSYVVPDSKRKFWKDTDLDLTGATLTDFDFVGCHPSDARFQGTTFVGVADFHAAVFLGKAQFQGAKFSGAANLQSAVFRDDARFDGATFSSDAWFSGAVFCSGAWLEGAMAMGDAWFVGATFSSDAWFEGAVFSGTADFTRVTFSGMCICVNVTFSFAGFQHAVYSSIADFTKATFAGAARFDRATFEGHDHFCARFSRAMFSNDARFDESTFAGHAKFDNATFVGDADFVGAKFEGVPLFDGAAFLGKVDLLDDTFPRPWPRDEE